MNVSAQCTGHRCIVSPPGYGVCEAMFSKDLTCGEAWPCAVNKAMYGYENVHRRQYVHLSCLQSFGIFCEENQIVSECRVCVLCNSRTSTEIAVEKGMNIISFCRDNFGVTFGKMCIGRECLERLMLYSRFSRCQLSVPASENVSLFNLYRDGVPNDFLVMGGRGVPLNLESMCRLRLGEGNGVLASLPRALRRVNHKWVGFEYEM